MEPLLLTIDKPTERVVVAIQGCAHGELDQIYNSLHTIEERHSIKISLLLCCGDFQAIRDERDLRHMHCPAKYR
jgi:lariat debranching enzyme